MKGIQLSKAQIYDLFTKGKIINVSVCEFDFSNGERFNKTKIIDFKSQVEILDFVEVSE